MRYSITGPTDLTAAQKMIVHAVITGLEADLTPEDEFTSGCAFGVDTEAMLCAMSMPFKVLRLTVPYLRHNGSLARRGQENGWDVQYINGGYMARNDATVANTDVLLAFPPRAEEEVRSRTWATIRRARKAGCEIRFFPLDGSPAWVEAATAGRLV